jgi:PAS domain S-box-containing protein
MDSDDRVKISHPDELLKKTKRELVEHIELLLRKNCELENSLHEIYTSLESVNHLGTILDESILEIFVFDKDTLRFIHANRKARENLGYSMRDLSGLTVFELTKYFGGDKLLKMSEPLRKGKADKVEYIASHLIHDGTSHHVEVQLQSSTFNKTPIIVAVILDITKRNPAEERLSSPRSTSTRR